ncbi:MAG: hypothetical protein ACJ76M_15455 [Solirubrobacteraceae bacterium]
MTTSRVADAARPSVERATVYAARFLGRPAPMDLDTLTARNAAHLLRTIDAVCATAPADELPFEDYAVLDELGATLADWLRYLWRSSSAARPIG